MWCLRGSPGFNVQCDQILLLGAGESGKSTFSKQLKLLNKGVISDNEKLMYRKGEAHR